MTPIGIDVGNTRIKLHDLPAVGLPADPGALLAAARAIPERLLDPERAPQLPADARVEIVSVRPAVTARLLAALALPAERVRVWTAAELPIANPYADPARLGPDRPLAALAARRLVGAPTVVVDAGTAVTVDLVDRAGRFAGGAIAPGFGLIARALGEGGAMLERVARPRREYPGRDTTEALELGAGAAFQGAIRLLVAAALEREPDARVVVTGGDAGSAAAILDDIEVLVAPLVPLGLWLLSRESRS